MLPHLFFISTFYTSHKYILCLLPYSIPLNITLGYLFTTHFVPVFSGVRDRLVPIRTIRKLAERGRWKRWHTRQIRRNMKGRMYGRWRCDQPVNSSRGSKKKYGWFSRSLFSQLYGSSAIRTRFCVLSIFSLAILPTTTKWCHYCRSAPIAFLANCSTLWIIKTYLRMLTITFAGAAHVGSGTHASMQPQMSYHAVNVW